MFFWLSYYNESLCYSIWLGWVLICPRHVSQGINLPKVYGPRSQIWPRFYLILKQIIRSVNLPKVCGPRNQAWPIFCLILKQIIGVTHNVINKNMVEMTFINNNTFAGYLHFRGMVQHFHLDLQGNMHIFQPPRWYDMPLPNWALTFPMLGSLQYPQPFLILSLQALMALTSHSSRTPSWASVNNMTIKPWHFLFTLQSNLSSSLIIRHYCSK